MTFSSSPFGTRFASRQRQDLLLTTLIGLLATLLLALLFGYQEIQRVQQQTLQNARISQQAIDRLLDDVGVSLRQIEPLINLPCPELRSRLIPIVAANPYLRAIGAIDQRRLYCLTSQGPVDVVMPQLSFARPETLWLAPRPSAGAGGTSLELLRRLPDGHSVLATLDMQLLRPFLRRVLLNNLQDHGLVIGEQLYLGGQLLANLPHRGKLSVQVDSHRYPFSVLGYNSQRSLWLHVLDALQLKLPLLLLVGVLAGFVSRRVLQRWRAQSGRLEQALRNQEFLPYYQPLIDAHSGRCIGAEALMRWQPPGAALIPPDRFIPQLEENGQISAATALLMRQVAADLSRLALPPDFHLSININPNQLADPALSTDTRLLQDAVAPQQGRIVLELTERVALESTGDTQATLQRLREQGVKIAIDDFGTGHSSLAYLTELKVDYLKIDRRFVATIRNDAASAVLDAIIALGRQLNLVTVAEGVETERQVDYLRARQVTLLQGFLYARPMPFAQFADYLVDNEQADRPVPAEPLFSRG